MSEAYDEFMSHLEEDEMAMTDSERIRLENQNPVPIGGRRVYATLVVMHPPAGGEGAVDTYPGPWKLVDNGVVLVAVVHLTTGVVVPWHNVAWLVPA